MMRDVRVPAARRRLRHVVSFLYRCASVKDPEDVGLKIKLFADHGKDSEPCPIYESEVVSGTAHPHWSRLDASIRTSTQEPSFCAEIISVKKDGGEECVLERTSFRLDELSPVANSRAALSTVRQRHRGLILECVDGIFQPDVPSNDTDDWDLLGDTLDTRASSRGTLRAPTTVRLCDIKALAVTVLQRHYALRAVAEDVDAMKEEIRLHLDARRKMDEKRRRISELKYRTASLSAENGEKRRSLLELQQANDVAKADVEHRRKTLDTLEEELSTRQAGVEDTRTTLSKTLTMCTSVETCVERQRLIMLDALRSIFPIQTVPTDATRAISLRGLKAPTDSSSDNDAAVFYGDVAHVVYFVANLYNVKLIHPVSLRGSRSCIVEDNGALLPLYVVKSSDRPKLKVALTFLTQDIIQLLRHLKRVSDQPEPILGLVHRLLGKKSNITTK